MAASRLGVRLRAVAASTLLVHAIFTAWTLVALATACLDLGLLAVVLDPREFVGVQRTNLEDVRPADPVAIELSNVDPTGVSKGGRNGALCTTTHKCVLALQVTLNRIADVDVGNPSVTVSDLVRGHVGIGQHYHLLNLGKMNKAP